MQIVCDDNQLRQLMSWNPTKCQRTRAKSAEQMNKNTRQKKLRKRDEKSRQTATDQIK